MSGRRGPWAARVRWPPVVDGRGGVGTDGGAGMVLRVERGGSEMSDDGQRAGIRKRHELSASDVHI